MGAEQSAPAPPPGGLDVKPKHSRKLTTQLKRAEIARTRNESVAGMEGVAEEDEGREATSMADAAARRRERRAARESGANRRRRRVEEEDEEDDEPEEEEGVEEDDPDAVEGEDSDAKRERQDRRRRAQMAQSAAGDNAGDEGGPSDLNFNRDFAKRPSTSAAAGAGALSPDGTVSDLQVGVLDDDPANGGGRPRNKDSQMGIGPPIAKMKVTSDDEALDSEALRAFAFKSPQADEDALANEFVYELPEVAARLGSRLKLLCAGFDEAVWHIPHYTPIPSTYSAYSLGVNAWNGSYHTGGYVFDDGTGNPVVETGGVDPAFGSEYRAEPEPFTEEEIKLARAAGKRRQRKITRELHWQKEKAKAKAKEREAKRLKDLADRDERSQSGGSSRGSVFGGSAAASRRTSAGGGAQSGGRSNLRSLQMGGMGASRSGKR